jgi:hypothetical protein
MTTQRQMTQAYVAQEQVIAALCAIDETDLASRLELCATVRRNRHGGDGWPRTCRCAACVWCRPPLIRGWWLGMCQWAAKATTSSLAIIPIDSSARLPVVVRRLRRGLRDVRDRQARHRRRWRAVGFAGMTSGNGTALVLVAHEGVDRREILDVLGRRWPTIAVKNLEQEQPAVAMTAGDAADLGWCRRGTEPLRIIILPQHDPKPIIAAIIEPMPVIV